MIISVGFAWGAQFGLIICLVLAPMRFNGPVLGHRIINGEGI